MMRNIRNAIIVLAILIGGNFLYSYNSEELSAPADDSQPIASTEETLASALQAPCGLTATRTAGPYYISSAPDLVDSILNYSNLEGEPITLNGYVYKGADTSSPVASAAVDLWQADGKGQYYPLADGDHTDYTPEEVALRGVVYTDENGYYEVKTILPSEYEERPRHLHVKVRGQDSAELTTQLYWQLDGDSNTVTEADMPLASQPCQVLTSRDDSTYTYDFYLE